MTTEPTLDRLTISVDRTKAERALQVNLSLTDSEGNGVGYRLAGPKHYNMGTTELLSYELGERDAAEIRRMLDAVFPVAVEQPTPAPDLPTPAVGDRYAKRAGHDHGRVVTVNRVWTDDDGRTAVAYEWGDRGQCGSACPLGVFRDAYQPEAEPPDSAPALSDNERWFLTFALDQAAEHMSTRGGFTDDDRAALASLRRLAGGEQA